VTDLSHDQERSLAAYERLLRDPGVRRGVIARGDEGRIHDRHLLDALRAAPLVHGPEACDLGSGGGLPGIPLAIARGDVTFVLTEQRANRADFLRLAVETLGLRNVRVHGGDAGALPAASVDTCTARAFARAAASWGTAERLLRPGGILLYWAGASFDLARDVPAGVRADVSDEARVAGSGPLVIMGRQ
jgi:16S rRNA (guanine527-N7)-methyltransferase